MALTPIDLTIIAAGTGGFAILGQDASDEAGFSVASAGDINGDGFDDLIIGARYGDAAGNAKANAGESYVIFGRAAGFGASIDLTTVAGGSQGFVIYGQDAGDRSGFSVASAGDLNGDGFDDLIIGARYGDAAGNAKTDAGDSYVVFGKASGFGASLDLTKIAAGSGGFVIHGRDAGDTAGASVASAGDFNGDGFDDLIIGARYGDAAGNAKANAGESYVIFGKATGFGASIDLTTIANGIGGFVLYGQDPFDLSGAAVASAGDVNGDGLDDLIIGAHAADSAGNATSDAGESYVVFGTTAGIGASLSLATVAAGTGGFVIHGRNTVDLSGFSVASAGDINGDGFADLIIGAPFSAASKQFGVQVGEAYVLYGKASGFGASVDLATIAAGTGGFVIRGLNTQDQVGISVAAAGDINADGYDDIIIGADRAASAGDLRAGAGESYVVLGRRSGFGASVDLTAIFAGTGGFVIDGQDAGDRSGRSVASAGDIDGDGYDDLLIGAHAADGVGNLETSAGDSYVVFGKDFTGTVTHAGTAGADTLVGTNGKDTMVGGQGNDTLFGNGGADVIFGGAGADFFSVPDLTFRRIDGGTGVDTLVLEGSQMVLDLTTLPASTISDIEVIDLTGTGPNTLKVSARAVLNLSSTTNTLRVEGNKGDLLNFGSESSTNVGTFRGYTTYTRGEATLEVDTDLALGYPAIDLTDVANGMGGFVIQGQDAEDRSGTSVASAGDINGDGFDDLIIGADRADGAGNVKSGAGDSYVVFGKSGGFGASLDLTTIAGGTGGFVIFGQDELDLSGDSVASAGDLNGDGFDDLIVGASGAYGEGNAKRFAGESYVVFGKAGGFGASLDLTTIAAGTGGFVIFGQDELDGTGRSVASAGDVNGDGFDDLIIGAPTGDTPGNVKSGAGESYVVFGKAGDFGAGLDLATIAGGTGGFVVFGQDANDLSGRSVASAGDVNGDGFDDLIIGAPYAQAAGNVNGRAGESYVVFGKAGGFGASIALATIAAGTGGFVISGQDVTDLFGYSVASAGDVNGDGFDDLVVGAYLADAAGNARSAAGDSYVIFGKAGDFGASIDLSTIAAGTGGFAIYGQDGSDRSGFSVASAGDVNGDGFDDLVIGAHLADAAGNAKPSAGDSYVVFGKEGGFGPSFDLATIAAGTGGFVIYGQEALDQSGRSVASAGDVNGDGFDDLFIGAPYADAGGNAKGNAGESYVIFGGDFSATVTHQGGAGSDALTGTSGADNIVAGLGDDMLDGRGGVDVLLGAGGNDTIKVPDLTFQRIDGGTGVDTLALDGGGTTFDLTTIASNRLRNIEVIDITGSGDNILKLSALRILNLSSSTNTLTIDGNLGDTVLLGSGVWVEGGTTGGYTTYTSGQAVARVSTAVTLAGFNVTRPDMDAASDTGASSGDNNTKDVTPTFSGLAAANATVTLLAGTTVLGAGMADGNGAWSITAAPMADGRHAIRARATDPSGTTGPDSATLLVTIDTTLSPTPSAPDLVGGSDGGVSSVDDITRNDRPIFQGMAEAGATVMLYDGATLVGTGKANVAGAWAIRASTLAEGAHVITATASDAAGNSAGPSAGLTVTIDRTAPERPSRPDLAAGSDAGRFDNDNVTNVTTPVFTGTAEAGSAISLLVGSTVIGSGTADGIGAWSIMTTALSEGKHAVQARATDAAGNKGLASPGQFVTIDTTPEVAPVLLKATATAISGTAATGTTIRLFEGATEIGSAIVSAAGTWVAPIALAAGNHIVTGKTIDRAGNVSAASDPLSLVLGGAGDDDLVGTAGADWMVGRAGNDTYHVNHLGDVVSEAGGGTADTILASVGVTLGATSGIEFLAAATGAGGLPLTGNEFANTITGGDGNDMIVGAGGADFVVGGLGADIFVLLALTDSTVDLSGQDTIDDFSALAGDLIGLKTLDADIGEIGNQAFTFIGAAAFSGSAGELRAEVVGGATLVSGDVNGDSAADFAIRLTGSHALTGANFTL